MLARLRLYHFVILALLLGALAGLLAWLPWNPLEGPAGPLDRILPPGLHLVVRLQPDAVLDTPSGRTVWQHPTVADLKKELGLDERLLAPIRRVEASIAKMTPAVGAAPTLRGDLIGRDVVIGVRGDEILLASRMSGRARALELIRKMEPGALAEFGVHVDGEVGIFAREGLPTVFVTRHRDVLLLSTSRTMVLAALRRGERLDDTGTSSTYSGVLDIAAPAGGRVLFHARPAELFHGLLPVAQEIDADGAVVAENALSVWRSIFPPESLGPINGVLDLSGHDGAVLQLHGEYGDGIPERVAGLPGDVPGGARGLRDLAEQFAVPGATISATGLSVSAEEAVRTLVDSQPPERRSLLEDVLADEGTTVDRIANALGKHLQDGVGAVVARLEETDELELDDPYDGGQAHPIPATLVAFRLTDVDGGDELLDELSRQSDRLFGGPLDLSPVLLEGGGRLYRLQSHAFGAMWRHLSPAVALVDDLFVFCTNETYLQRALKSRVRSARSSGAPSSARTLITDIRADTLRQFVDDQRWEWAHRRAYHDWRSERQAIREALDARSEPLTPAERVRLEDEEIDRRIADRNKREFPGAIAEYREAWAPLGVLGDVRVEASLHGRSFTIETRIGLHAR